MGNSPLFTPEEIAEWDAKAKAAKEWRDTDDIMRPEGPNPYNRTVYKRTQEVERARRWAWIDRLRSRPEDILSILLIAFHERGSEAIIYDEVFQGTVGERLSRADNPETRAHLHAILSGLKIVPRSWARSATTRFFRGIGKQGKPPWSEKPGAGMLSKDYGWNNRQAEWFVGFFFGSSWGGVSIGELFSSDDSPDCYGDEAYDIDEEGGNRFAATRKERDDDFYDTLLDILEGRGLGTLPGKQVKKPKPRKAKTWKVGDKITSRNLRDLPVGALVLWKRVQKNWCHRKSPDSRNIYTLTTSWHQLVYEGRPDTGEMVYRPVVKDTAFGKERASSSMLYKGGWHTGEVEATYEGMWEGTTMDVQIKDEAWKGCRRRDIKTFQRDCITDDEGRFIRWEERQIS